MRDNGPAFRQYPYVGFNSGLYTWPLFLSLSIQNFESQRYLSALAGLGCHFFSYRFYFLLVSSGFPSSPCFVGDPYESPLQYRNEFLCSLSSSLVRAYFKSSFFYGHALYWLRPEHYGSCRAMRDSLGGRGPYSVDY